jgi:hypothetical protein
MSQKRFARLTNGFSKKLTNHAAAVSLYVIHYNLCRAHEAPLTTPGVAPGIVDRVWIIGDSLDATLARRLRASDGVGTVKGQNRKSSRRAYVFRFAPESGHARNAVGISVSCQT